jgi:cytochrome c oxidase subunit 2
MVDTHHEYDSLARLYWPIAAGVVVVIFVLVIFFALRYRARADGRRPSRRSDAPWLERFYALLLGGVAALLLGFTFTTEAREDRISARPAVEIRVTASKWHWRFDYPAYGISEIGRDVTGAATATPAGIPTLYVPARVPVRFTITSVDVIHAFWIPQVKFKHDANPGHTERFDLMFPHAGAFPTAGECSEFCGLNHAGMEFDVRAMAPAEFAAWARAHRGRS